MSLRPAATNLLIDLKLIRYHEPLEIQRSGLDLEDVPLSIVKEAKVRSILIVMQRGSDHDNGHA
jgi:hypothetical protein